MADTEITYAEAAAILEVSIRQVRRIIRKHKTVKPIRLGHRTVRFQLDKIVRLKRTLRQQALRRAA